MFKHIKVGDVVCREFCGRHLMKVTAVDDELITAGMGWQFNREDGVEWDPDVPSISGMSRLVPLNEEEQKQADEWRLQTSIQKSEP